MSAGTDDLAPHILEALRRISHHHCVSEGGSHGPDHSERVCRMAVAMAGALGARRDIVTAAALLHDIGRKEETRRKGGVCHAVIGAELAGPILTELGFAQQDIEAILHCIRAHRYRGREQPASLEAKILFDADKLDSIGAIGIGRAFLFAGQIGARLHDAEIDHGKTNAYSTEDTAYREFQVKMSRVRGRMLTPLGARLAEKRHVFMEVFFSELNREIYGSDADLLQDT